MKLTINDIKNRTEFMLPQIPCYDNGSPITDRHIINDLVNKVTPIYICNPFVDASNNKWRNCKPIKAYIKDCNILSGDWSWIERLKNSDRDGDVNFANTYTHGYFAVLERSMYDGHDYVNNSMIDLEFALDENHPETNHYIYYLSRDNTSKDAKRRLTQVMIKKYFVVFDNEKEANAYIKKIRKNSDFELNRLKSEMENTKSLISKLQKKLINLQEEINKLENN